MKTLAKYHICNHFVPAKKTFKNLLIGPGMLPGLSRNGPQVTKHTTVKEPIHVRRGTFLLICCSNNFKIYSGLCTVKAKNANKNILQRRLLGFIAIAFY